MINQKWHRQLKINGFAEVIYRWLVISSIPFFSFIACRIINHEMVVGIEMANDDAKTKIGSYRVDPNGNQKTKEVCCENKI